jgi:hypothetical protein
MSFFRKIGSSLASFGNKVNNDLTKFGKSIPGDIQKIGSGISQGSNVIGNVLDKASGIVNKIDSVAPNPITKIIKGGLSGAGDVVRAGGQIGQGLTQVATGDFKSALNSGRQALREGKAGFSDLKGVGQEAMKIAPMIV